MVGPSLSSEFLSVAYNIIERERRDLSAREIVNIAFREGLFTDNIAGKTPEQTMKSKLSVHVRRQGAESTFVRTRPGKFYLRHLLDGTTSTYEAPPISPPNELARVLVFPSVQLDAIGRFQGVSTEVARYRPLLGARNTMYVERLEAEGREDTKQVLTYVLVRSGERVLAYKRGTYNRVEQFLRGAHCIGFGGHVTEGDFDLFGLSDSGLTSSAIRELSEELTIPSTERLRLAAGAGLKLIAAINDDSSAVGRRHFAFVFEYVPADLEAWQRPLRGEKSITQLRWTSAVTPDQPLVRFEYWSQLCLLSLFATAAPSAPEFIARRTRPLQPPNILCVAGPIGSGKSEATRILREEFGYTEINSGRVVASLLRLPPVPQTDRETFQRAAWKFIMSARGPERLASAMLQSARLRGGDRLLFDGIRQPATLEALRQLADKHHVGLLYIHTPAHIALDFYRDRTDASIKPLEFFAMREAPVEGQVIELLPKADAVIYNWTGKPTYHLAIRQLMAAVGVLKG